MSLGRDTVARLRKVTGPRRDRHLLGTPFPPQVGSMCVMPIGAPAVSERSVYRFGLVDDAGVSAGRFSSRRRGWRIGDWLIAEHGRRVRIVAVLPAWEASEEQDVEAIWVVEPA